MGCGGEGHIFSVDVAGKVFVFIQVQAGASIYRNRQSGLIYHASSSLRMRDGKWLTLASTV